MWKTLKSFVVEEDPKDATAAPAPQGVQQAPKPGQPAFVPPVYQHEVNNQFVDALRTALKGRSTAYTALLNGAEKLAAYIPDQTMRFKASFDQIKTEGRGVKEIAAAIEVHAQDLSSQQMHFIKALDQERAKTVGECEAELRRLEPANANAQQQIENMEAQIVRLREQISGTTQRQLELQQQVTIENDRIATQKQQFETAMNIVKSELDAQKNIILTALS